MERYICIHGHFYQPPRENPWLEAIELQDSAYPYHDWNERITAESYAPNAASRILDEQGRITDIVNNYGRINFNFGPTLLAWMEHAAPETYAAVLEADRESRDRFSGHGSAMAQAYNHIIMPLANDRDRRTQVLWGLRDFEHRFGREPEGMWLPETAVDIPTLEDLAAAGIRFTVLAPNQAGRVRPLDGGEWTDAQNGNIDPTRPYVQKLPSGKSIVLFFYDGPISRAVAFEELLENGKRFAERIMSGFSDERDWPQIMHIATDGETYGHHHPHGEMALSYALRHIEAHDEIRLTNYGEYLERHPPTHEVEIVEDTSWSCAHGVGRWNADCGCHTGGEPGWNQAWRAPLREALDWLRDQIAPRYEAEAGRLFDDPWAARDEYIEVVLDRSPESVDAFLARHAGRALEPDETVTALKLLELQRYAMVMYTSCGWFFNELSGIETVQVIAYAGRVIQLAQEVLGDDLEPGFLDRLERAESNVPEMGDGRRIYERFVRPSRVDLEKVGAHYAASSIFDTFEDRSRVYCYTVDRLRHETRQAGRARFVAGRVRITSVITRESGEFTYGTAHFGDHNLTGGVRPFQSEEALDSLFHEATETFSRADFPATVRLLDRHFDGRTHSIGTLFRDEQRRIIERILEATVQDAEAAYRRVYENHAPLIRFLTELQIPLPNAFDMAAELVLNTELAEAFGEPEPDNERIRTRLDEAQRSNVALDTEGLGFALRDTLDAMAARLRDAPDDIDLLHQLESTVELARSLPFDVGLWTVQNHFHALLEETYPEMRERADSGDEAAAEWVRSFASAGETLSIAVP